MKVSSVIAAITIFVGIGAAAGGLAMMKQRSLAEAEASKVAYEPAEAVEIVTAREVAWQPTAELVGTAFSLRSVRVSNELAGRVKSVEFDSGAVVEAGQVLLSLDDAADRADLAVAEAAVKVAEANVGVIGIRITLWETEHERLENATARAVAAMELDRAKAELEAGRAERLRLEAEVVQARARVEQVQTRLEKMVIRAPFKARAGIRLVHEGQYLAEDSEVVMLEELADKIYLDFAIPQDYLARVQPGTAVMATSSALGDEPMRIEVVAVDAMVNNQTRNIRVRSIVDNSNQLLRPGMFVRIKVPVEEPKRYVAVSSKAIRRASHADHVFVIVPGEAPGTFRAKHQWVRLGPSTGDDVIILEGLQAGEQIASTGSFKLRDGVLVMSVEPGKAGNPGEGSPGGTAPGAEPAEPAAETVAAH
jgi:membrane fusion protein, multidrug efflux system